MSILSECKTLEDFKQVYQREGENIFTNLLYSEVEELHNNMLAYETALMLAGNPYDVDFRYYTFRRVVRKIVKTVNVESESYTFWKNYYENLVGKHGKVFIEKDINDDEFIKMKIDYYTLNIASNVDVILEGFWKSKVLPLIKYIGFRSNTILTQQEYWGYIQELVRYVNELKQLVDGL